MAQGVRVVGRKAWEREVVEAQLYFIHYADGGVCSVCLRDGYSRVYQNSAPLITGLG